MMVMDGITVRHIRSDEVFSYVQAMFWAAGRAVDNEFVEEQRKTFSLERALAAFDGHNLVGTVGTRPLRMTLPGGNTLPIAAIGQGGVLPSHTRKGIMRALMMRSFDAARDCGEPLAAWTTSEWPLYERYGGGVATFSATYALQALGHDKLREGTASKSKTLVVSDLEVFSILPELHARSSTRAGGVPRAADYWKRLFDRLKAGKSVDVLESRTDLPGPMFCLSTNPAGDSDGCCIYRVHQKWQGGVFCSQMEIIAFVYATEDAARSLWSFLTKTDLVKSIFIPHAPLSEPLRWMLRDGRQLETMGVQDHIWLRLLDPIKVLEMRKFPLLSAPLRLRFYDPLQLAANATLEIISDGKNTCVTTTEAKPNTEMEIGVLSSLVLGGVSVWDLAAAGRISYDGGNSLAQLAHAFTSGSLPFTDTSF